MKDSTKRSKHVGQSDDRVTIRVFLLWFVLDDEDDDALLIGVYESEDLAQAAIERLRHKPGFVDAPDSFQIHVRQVGDDSWKEGFVRDGEATSTLGL